MTNRVKIGLHYIPTHGRNEDMDAVAACPSPSVKVVYSSFPDPNHLRTVMARTSGLVVLRDHAKSEQKDDIRRDPAGTGRRHAQEWRNTLDAIAGLDLSRIIVEGVNEYPQWEPNGIQTQLAYELAFGNEGQRLALNTIHGEFPVGWPGNGGIADAPPNWTPWLPLLEWIRAHPGTFLGLHEYWGFNKGVHFYAGWWFLRYRKMPIKVPTMLTELGGLKAYQNPDGSWGLNAQDGWKGDISANEYAVQWREAEGELLKDGYIHSAHLFTTDGGHPWIEECDANPVNPQWIAWAQQQPVVDAGTNQPDIFIPGVTNPVMPPPGPAPTNGVFHRALAFVLQQEGGWSDNPADPGGATMHGITLSTYRAWRQAHGQPIPSKEDLRNISDAEVEQIYYQWYWLASGADRLPWPMALGHFDLAVNGGVGRAQQALADSGPNFLRYAAWRMEWYTRISGWPTFGAAWTRRVAAVLREGAV